LSTVLDRLKLIMVGLLDWIDESQVTEEADLVQLKVDDADMERIIAAVEKEFSIVIPPDVDELLTVGDFVECIGGCLRGQTGRV